MIIVMSFFRSFSDRHISLKPNFLSPVQSPKNELLSTYYTGINDQFLNIGEMSVELQCVKL